MSQQHIPASALSSRLPRPPSNGVGASSSSSHHPLINASSKKVISARERRERLLAYHTAVRLLQDAGVRPGDRSSGGSPALDDAEKMRRVSMFCAAPLEGVPSSPFSPLQTDSGSGTFSSTDDRLNEIQQAVAAYEQQHMRTLHKTIALEFVDKQGNLLIPMTSSNSPDTTPQGSPRNGKRSLAAPQLHDAVPSTQGAQAAANLPGEDILRQVREIFSGGSFSYFDEKRRQIMQQQQQSAHQKNPTASPSAHAMPGHDEGKLEPPTELGITNMMKAAGPQIEMDSLFQNQGQKGLWARQSGMAAASTADKEAVRNLRIRTCITNAVERHMHATCGGNLKYHRRSSDAVDVHQSSPFASRAPQPPTSSLLTKAGVPPRRVLGSKHPKSDGEMTVDGWLRSQPAMVDAVAAATDLLMLVLMKSLPACLFAGDEARFMDLLVEEREVLWRFSEHAGRSNSTSTVSGAGHADEPLLNFSFSATYGAGKSVLSSSNLDRRLFVEDTMTELALRASQRAERSLSRVNANRLFMLIEVEQTHSGGNIARALQGLPLADLVAEEQNTAKNDNFELATGRSSRAGSGHGPRRVEKIELERERRKREAMRPPRDPLQAVASSQHCWLSLTTARLKQMPLHACDAVKGVNQGPPPAEAVHSMTSHVATKVTSNASSRRATIEGGADFIVTPRLLGVPSHEDSWLATPTTLKGRIERATVFERDVSRSVADSNAVTLKSEPASVPGGSPLKASIPAAAGKHKSAVDRGAFGRPEQTIIPIVDLLSVMYDTSQYTNTDDSNAAAHTGARGSRLQEVVGPVELHLLLEIATSYASLVQSLHSGTAGTQQARFLDRNRDRIIAAASEVIVNASIEYLDFFVASANGHRGLPRPKPAPTATQGRSDVTSVVDTPANDQHRNILASIRPFGRRVMLSKDEVSAILSSSAQDNPATGGVVIGNEHDAHRAALRLLEQNRAVLHEVIARVKGEMYFLLTGVDSRGRILEEEQIAVEKKQTERNKMRRMRETGGKGGPPSPLNPLGTTSASPQANSATATADSLSTPHHHPGSAFREHQHAVFHSSHRGSFHYLAKGSDIVGHVNKTRFQAMIEELVGSSSEEEEQHMEAAQEAEDLSRPVFDWQRQNFADRNLSARPRRRGGSPSGAGLTQRSKKQSLNEVDADSSRQGATLPKIEPQSVKSASSRLQMAPPRKPMPPLLDVAEMDESILPEGTESYPRHSPAMHTLLSPKSASNARNRIAVTKRVETVATTSPKNAGGITADSNEHMRVSSRRGSLSAVGSLNLRSEMCPTTPKAPSSPGNPLANTAAQLNKMARRRFTRMLVPTENDDDRRDGGDERSPFFASLANVVQQSNARGSLIALVDDIPLDATATSEAQAPPASKPAGDHASSAFGDGSINGNQPHRLLQHGAMHKSFASKKMALRSGGANGDKPVSATTAAAMNAAGQHGPIAGRVNAIEKARVNLRAPESLSIVALQQELMELERSRRRAGRTAETSPSRTSIPKKNDPESGAALQGGTEANDVLSAAYDSVTASVVGVAEAAVVEKFKKACNATMQHLYTDAIDRDGGAGGFAWYEQGRPCAGERTIRAAALRGVQQGRFDLNGLTPIAALRLAMSSVAPPPGECDASPLDKELARLHNDAHPPSPQLTYPRRPLGPGGRDLLWTL